MMLQGAHQDGLLNQQNQRTGKGAGKGFPFNMQAMPTMAAAVATKKTGKTVQKDYHAKFMALKGKQQPRTGFGNWNNPNGFRDWSVAVRSDWPMVHEIALPALSKMRVDPRHVKKEDICWAGPLYEYKKTYDRITCRTAKNLPVSDEVKFYNPTSKDDEKLTELMLEDETIDVIATDKVLACIMAAPRSVYSWDLVITKIQGKLIIDKRDGSSVDLLTVNETAQEPPSNEDRESINAPLKLSREAARVNQNFSQALTDMQKEAAMQEEAVNTAHPFAGPGQNMHKLSGTCYRYRKITIPGNKKGDTVLKQSDITLLVRTEITAKSGNNYVAARCLNELPSKNQPSWSSLLEGQAGACAALEIKQNSFKMGRWVCEAILGGCDQFKLGYATRINVKDPNVHEVLSVVSYPIGMFSQQISMGEDQAFGILRYMLDHIRGMPEDGKYLLLKDPNKGIVRLYLVPMDTFDEEDEEISNSDSEYSE